MKLEADKIIRRYNEAKAMKVPYESEFRKVAALCIPRQTSGWHTQGIQGSAMTKASAQTQPSRNLYDITMVRAVPKFRTVLDRIMTPRAMLWHGVEATDRALNRQYRVKQYFEEVRYRLFTERYQPRANFEIAQADLYTSIGVYGTSVKFISERSPAHGGRDRGGLHYRGVPLYNCYPLRNDDGVCDTMFRRLDLNAYQYSSKFVGRPGVASEAALPEHVSQELKKPVPSQDVQFEIAHAVFPNTQFEPLALDVRRHPFFGVYIDVKSKTFIGEPEGFSTFPYVVPRHFTAEAGDNFGYSPAAMAMGVGGLLNAIKKTLVRQGQKAVDPPLLLHDDGVIDNVDMRPGAKNFGGVNAQGQKLIQTLETGSNFQVAEKLIEDDRADVDDLFLANIFKLLTETPDITATTAMEIIAEKAALCAPIMGRMQAEDLEPNIEREIDILTRMGRLPPVPPELREAGAEYHVRYTSPLARAQKQGQVTAFFTLAKGAAEVAQMTSDPTIMKRFAFDRMLPEAAEIGNVPLDWMATDNEVAQQSKQVQDERDADQAARVAPAVAGAAKAAANLTNATGGE